MGHKFFIASGALAIALVASPAFAESGSNDHEDQFGLKIGNIVRLLNQSKSSKAKAEHAAQASSTVVIHGTVTAVSGTTLTLSGKNAAVYTVNAASSTVDDGTLADIAVGDTIKVKGTVSGTTIIASRISDREMGRRGIEAQLENLRAGIVTGVSSSGFTITRFGTGTSSSVITSASTTIKVNGKVTTSSAITQGSTVVVVGTSGTTTPDSVAGGVVHVITRGFGWLKHFFFRW